MTNASNQLTVFNNEEFGKIRTILINDTIWFVGKDVAECLGYSNTNDALKNHVDNEDKIIGAQNATPSIIDSLGRTQYPTWINESGLYSLILSSKLETSKKFKRWVTSEILPSIHKTGNYSFNNNKLVSEELEIRREEIRIKEVEILYKLTEIDTLSKEYKNIISSLIVNKITGQEILALPKSEKRAYSATEIGDMFGISANKIGRLANKHKLKSPEYGEYRRTLTTHGKELDTWVYYDEALPIIESLIKEK